MRFAWALLIAACELRPAPKQQPAPIVPLASADAGAQQDAGPELDATAQLGSAAAPTVAAGSGASSSPVCIAVGRHLAEVVINGAGDPAQRGILEQERDTMARKTAETCTLQKWNDAALACLLGTKAPPDITKCERQFPPPPPP